MGKAEMVVMEAPASTSLMTPIRIHEWERLALVEQVFVLAVDLALEAVAERAVMGMLVQTETVHHMVQRFRLCPATTALDNMVVAAVLGMGPVAEDPAVVGLLE